MCSEWAKPSLGLVRAMHTTVMSMYLAKSDLHIWKKISYLFSTTRTNIIDTYTFITNPRVFITKTNTPQIC